MYQIVDPFLRFWFRYVHTYRGSLELGLADTILEQQMRPTFNHFVGYAFEEAAREYVAQLARRGDLFFLPDRVGKWWDRQTEVDVIAISDSERSLLAGECKWSVNPVGTNILDDLKRKVRRLNTDGKWRQVHYVLFARAGFTPALQDLAVEDVKLVEAVEMV